MRYGLLEDWVLDSHSVLRMLLVPRGICCTKQADVWMGRGLAQLHGSKAGFYSAKCLILGNTVNKPLC